MEIKGVTIFVTLATILAVIGLGYTFMASKAQSEANENIGVEIEDLDSDLSSLQDVLNALNGSLTQLSDDLDDLDVELRGDIADTEYDVSNIQTEMIQLQNELSIIWEDFQTDIGSLEYDVSSLTQQVSDIQSDLSTIQIQITDLQGDLSDVQVDIANLQSDVTSLSTQISDIQNDISTIQSSILGLQGSVLLLQSDVSSLEDRVTALEMERAITIRVNFLSFVPDNSPPGGEDYLFDGEVVGTSIYAQDRTGHSRFIEPRYLDLVIENGTQFMGDQVAINIYAYWHLDDMVIDIDPDPAHGRTIGTDPNGGYLTLSYTIGSVLQGNIDGDDDGYLLDQYDAFLAYKVETL